MTNPVDSPIETGPQEGRCGAVRDRDAEGNPIRWCRNYPMKGQARCRLDGGKAPQALAAAERRLQEAEGRAYVAQYGLPVHVEWHEAMQIGLNHAYGALLASCDQVMELAPEQLTWDTTSVVTIGATQFPGVDTTKSAAIHPKVKLYGEALDRLFRMANDCGKMGVTLRAEEEAKRINTAIAEEFLPVIKRVLAGFGHDLTDPTVIARIQSLLRESAELSA